MFTIALMLAASNSMAAQETTDHCVMIDGAHVCVESWTYTHDRTVESRWEDLQVECLEDCSMFIIDEGDHYYIENNDSSAILPHAADNFAVLEVVGSDGEDSVSVYGIEEGRALLYLSPEDEFDAIE